MTVTVALLLYVYAVMANETRAISEALILESANTKALIQATTRSFEIIVPLSKAR
jgi:hypothetical protein